MKNERIEILQKVASGELTPEQADEQLLGLSIVMLSLPTGDELHKTMDGRYVLRAISFPIANKFKTHPEKVTDVVEQIIDNLNEIIENALQQEIDQFGLKKGNPNDKI